MNWQAIEQDRQYVLGKLDEGRFDSLERVTRVFETEFFHYMLSQGDLTGLAATYPSPRKREDVPLWVYLSSELSLRINASHGFKSLPYVLPCSGLRDALGPDQVSVRLRTAGAGQACDHWEGFNNKNAYARQTPCDPDYVRKMAKDTDPDCLMAWHNESVVRYYQGLEMYDPDGIFIADGTYLFVPDNPRYQNSAVMMFDEHNHPVSQEDIAAMRPEQTKKLHRERCYRKVALLHTSWDKDLYLYTGVKVMSGSDAESPELGPLVDGFVGAVGPGVMKVLIHDRGFLDGATISRNKLVHKVDTVFPLKKKMHSFDEALRLADFSEEPWRQYNPEESPSADWPAVRPEYIRRREEKRQAKVRQKKEEAMANQAPEPKLVRTWAKAVRELRVWDACQVPIHAVVMRDQYEDGQERKWVLATTMDFQDPILLRRYYQLRPTVEERIRQTKCFWDMTRFRSTRFSLVVNQIVFVLMAYTLVQLYLWKTGRKEMVRKTRDRLFQMFENQQDQTALYCDGRVAFLSFLELEEILLTLPEEARRKAAGRIRQLRAEQERLPDKPWRP